MKQKINILVVEDNKYYNNLIFNALQQSTHFVQKKMKYQLVLHSFIDSAYCMQKIESRVFIDNDFCVIKDTFAPALCRLYLDQFIENKFL